MKSEVIWTSDGDKPIRFVRPPFRKVGVPWVIWSDIMAAIGVDKSDLARLNARFAAEDFGRKARIGDAIDVLAPPRVLPVIDAMVPGALRDWPKWMTSAMTAAYPSLDAAGRMAVAFSDPDAQPKGGDDE